MRTQLADAGYEVQTVSYVNAVGAVAWLVLARFLRRDPDGQRSVRVFDKYFVPVLRPLERRWSPPSASRWSP